jgi:Protein of unknown function (DUF3592)/Mu transposase, C-terminal
MVVFGVWLVLAGAIAALAGQAGTARRRRLRGRGLTAWAMVLPTPADPADPEHRPAGVSVQFALRDGRVIERGYARPGRRSRAPQPGQRVLVWYDPADPADVLVYASDGRWSDRAFVAMGVLLIVGGSSIAEFAR